MEINSLAQTKLIAKLNVAFNYKATRETNKKFSAHKKNEEFRIFFTFGVNLV
jgi:hypothetical protein